MAGNTPRDVETVKRIAQVAIDVAAENEQSRIDIVTRLRAAIFFCHEAGLAPLTVKLEALVWSYGTT